MSNLSALKRSSSSALLAKLQKQIETSDSKQTFKKDERMWSPAVDKAGNGSAVIRFLPAKTDEGSPFVKLYTHGFEVGGKWFIENCPTTIGRQDCPVCAENSVLWKSEIEANKKVASARSRKVSYYANVLIIKDPSNPENEGEVKIYRFGQTIFDKIKAALNPEEDPETGEKPDPIDPFNFFTGASFILKISNVKNYRNYDSSKFSKMSELFDGNEDRLSEILDKLHDVETFVDVAKFKSAEELKAKFDQVTGVSIARGSVSVAKSTEQAGNSKPAVEHAPKQPEVTTPKGSDDSDDLEFFKNLAKGS